MKYTVKDYISNLTDVRDFLSNYDSEWIRILNDWLNKINIINGDRSSIKGHLKEVEKVVFGGMGSLQDLNIYPEAGFKVKEEDCKMINDTFHKKLAHLYEIICHLLKELELNTLPIDQSI